jgi:sugar lactone lactonase YvrE
MLFSSLALSAVLAAPPALPDGDPAPQVTTVAGSGVPGGEDGPATSASFVLPTAVAVDAAGRIFVADGGGNCIRVVESGRVRTLAGSRAAGFADGRGAAARFDFPAGIAVAADGTVFVADANNHAIRRIAADGTVSTAATGLGRPLQLALERDGALLVADPLSGLRRVARDGTVTTIALGEPPADRVYGVAVNARGDGETIFVADTKGLLVLRPDGRKERFFASNDAAVTALPASPNDAGAAITQGLEPLGFPYALAAPDADHVFYSDLRTNTIRAVDAAFRSARVVAGANVTDASGDTGGFADGPGAAARLDAPFGVALGSGGALFVADGANRRVRRIGDPGPGREPAIAGYDPLPLDQLAGAGPRVVMTGNSITWSNTQWNDSMQGIVEARLRRRDPSARVVAVTAPGAPAIAAFRQELDALAEAGNMRAAILFVSSINVMGEFGYADPNEVARHTDAWSAKWTASLRALGADLSARHVTLVVVVHPVPFELSLGETAWERVRRIDAIRSFGDAERSVRAAVAAAHVRTIDLWDVAAAAEAAPDHPALSGSGDAHLTAAGRALFARAIADDLDAHPVF